MYLLTLTIPNASNRVDSFPVRTFFALTALCQQAHGAGSAAISFPWQFAVCQLRFSAWKSKISKPMRSVIAKRISSRA